MSSPSISPSVKSASVSSPRAAETEFEDTASSAQGTGKPPVVTVQDVCMDVPASSPRQVIPSAPNTLFVKRKEEVRARSVSPRMRRTISPSRLSVAQRRAQLAEEKAESAFSGVGFVAEQT